MVILKTNRLKKFWAGIFFTTVFFLPGLVGIAGADDSSIFLKKSIF